MGYLPLTNQSRIVRVNGDVNERLIFPVTVRPAYVERSIAIRNSLSWRIAADCPDPKADFLPVYDFSGVFQSDLHGWES